MSDTSLSPRLRHLLIQEDRSTGNLILPQPTLVSHSDMSPPCSPPDSSYLPLVQKSPMTALHSIPQTGRQVSNSIFNLLNDLSVGSPPSSAGSHSSREPTRPTLSVLSQPQMPLSAPIISAGRPPFFSREHRPSVDTPQQGLPRPDLNRRHSAHPYEINPATNRIVYREFDFSPVGSRAPISRTTKACNACRSRKVRCDAGGGDAVTCSRCKEAGVECVYSGLQKKRGPCPGSVRPGMGISRRSSQKGATITPPEVSPTSFDAPSYGFPHSPRYGIHQHMSSPNDPHSPLGPTSVPLSQAHSGSGSGWTSSQPRPLTSNVTPPDMLARRPPSAHSHNPPMSSRPSIVSWHPSDIPEERSRMFEQEYSFHSLSNEDSVRHNSDKRDVSTHRPSSKHIKMISPTFAHLTVSTSAFGGDGRSLPPLSAALDRRSSYYSPRD